MRTPNDSSFAISARLLRQCLPGERLRIAVGLLLLFAATVTALLIPWPLKFVLDSVIGQAPLPAPVARIATLVGATAPLPLLTLLCGSILVLYLLNGLLTLASTWVLIKAGLRMVYALRCLLFTHMQRLSLAFHDSTSVGDSLYRVTWDTYSVQKTFNSALVPALTSLLMLLGIALFMWHIDALITVVALAVAVPLFVLIRWIDRPMSDSSMRVHERESELGSRVQETFGSIRVVQAFGMEPFENERFRARAGESLRANLRLTVLQTGYGVIVSLLLAAGTAAVAWLGALRVMQKELSVGEIVLLISYVAMLYKPLEALTYTAAILQSAAAQARRVFAVLSASPGAVDRPGAVELPAHVLGRIELQHVSFGYIPERPVLKEISLVVQPGQTVALVGPSGAGKTTLISLLMRFYDPQAGRILLDDLDIRQITLRSFRRKVALVLQEPILFAATIGENISYGRPEAGSDEIEAAARAAGAHEFIMALPEGYETHVAERGVTLSGGQRQRLSIARAFLKDAPILLMDEPTSALDTGTETALLEAWRALRQGRTTLIIAHRLSTVRDAHCIFALCDGRIVEAGTHEELLERGGYYASLHGPERGGALIGPSLS